MRGPKLLVAGCVFVSCIHCGGGSAPQGPTSPSPGGPPGTNPPPTPPPPSAPQVFVGAGDIGWCGSPGPEQTARLIDPLGGTVVMAGDHRDCSGPAQGE